MPPQNRPIYFDTAASMPVAKEAIATLLEYLGEEGCYYNPASSSHVLGQSAAAAIDSARENIAALLACHGREIVFTSSATEANNLAIFGIARAHSQRGRHIITSSIEHKCVLCLL